MNSVTSKLPTVNSQTVKSATAQQINNTARATTTKINSSVKDLKTTATESVRSIEKTVSPIVLKVLQNLC